MNENVRNKGRRKEGREEGRKGGRQEREMDQPRLQFLVSRAMPRKRRTKKFGIEEELLVTCYRHLKDE
jgi:hypothetical protein